MVRDVSPNEEIYIYMIMMYPFPYIEWYHPSQISYYCLMVRGKGLPSGKRLHNYGKSPFFIGKSTISTGPFSIAICKRLPEGYHPVI